jgi:alanyl-tRNA synthetase
VLNNVESNYDTDLFVPMFNKIHQFCNGSVNEYKKCNNEEQTAYRILADHMRSICVSISDGLVPSRNGLGGFLKYLILKNLKICQQTFKIQNASQLLCELVPLVVDSLKDAHPDILNKTEYIQQVKKFCLLHFY